MSAWYDSDIQYNKNTFNEFKFSNQDMTKKIFFTKTGKKILK